MRIAIIGAGAWGTALAVSAASQTRYGHDITLWARDAQQAAAMQAGRENRLYLPGVALPHTLTIKGPENSTAAALLERADLVVLATPMVGLRALLAQLAACRVPLAWLSKGFEAGRSDGHGCLAHEIQSQVAPGMLAGALSGPSFALEVARGQPTALVAASPHVAVRQALVAAFHGPTLRVYANDDLIGVEVGGAVKNVLAIATGLCDGLNLGANARAALITRGLAEMTRLGLALGARPDTFMGLSGLGDLVLTATGDLSRNRQVGLALAAGQSCAAALAGLGHVAEGVYSARTVVLRAQQLGLDLPIAQTVVALLDGQLQPTEAVSLLMGREPGFELAQLGV